MKKETTSVTELGQKLKYASGMMLMTAFGIGTSWTSGLVPILHRPVAA